MKYSTDAVRNEGMVRWCDDEGVEMQTAVECCVEVLE
jgi:hypothetical protein